MLNEKIKYCRKPFYDIFDEIPPKEEKRAMKCLSGLASDCLKSFKTTKNHRICERCKSLVQTRDKGLL